MHFKVNFNGAKKNDPNQTRSFITCTECGTLNIFSTFQYLDVESNEKVNCPVCSLPTTEEAFISDIM